MPPLQHDADRASYDRFATTVMGPYADGIGDLESHVEAAYAFFDHPDVVPLVDLGEGVWVMELFHGPTLAFKDIALQLVGRLMDHELRRRRERRTIVVATSGDTGSAAIEACVGRSSLDIVVLHPAGRVSDVQRRQMTTVDAPNVHNVAIEGTFDDCQDLVKALFADAALREEAQLGAMNSINWGRVLAQIPYYARAAQLVGACDVVVPTGNFGNILAGWYAKRGGAPIERLAVASNANDILTRWVRTGNLVTETVVPTLSPSMDIQVSSNHERLLFELLDRDGARTAELLTRFRTTGSVEAPRAHDLLAERGRRRRDARRDRADGPRARLRRRPAHRRRPRRRPRPGARTRAAGGVPGHRSPGEVPRRGGEGHGSAAGAAGPAGRPAGAARAVRRAAGGRRRGRFLRQGGVSCRKEWRLGASK